MEVEPSAPNVQARDEVSSWTGTCEAELPDVPDVPLKYVQSTRQSEHCQKSEAPRSEVRLRASSFDHTDVIVNGRICVVLSSLRAPSLRAPHH